MQRIQVMPLAEHLATGNQRWVVFQAGQLLPGLQQTSAQVTFARTPIQPMPWRFGKLQATGEGFDLLPLAARNIDVQSMTRGFQCMNGQFIHSAQGKGHLRQGRKWLWRIKQARLVMTVFRILQRAPA
ncbi:hypothetical protein D3C87_1177770 [compost metagenome]